MRDISVKPVSGKRESMTKIVEVREALACYLTRPIVRFLSRTSITPNILTWFGLLLTIGAAALIVSGHLFAAGFTVLVAGLFDMLDGALARHTGQITRFGGILDSVIDRLAEAVLLLGLLLFYAGEQSMAGILLVGIALPGSLLVSYIRARAEAAGLECKAGLFTRSERVVVLALGLLLSQFAYALLVALGVIALFSLFTVYQRLLHIWRQTRAS